MASTIAKSIADLQYGGLYLPILSLAYLYNAVAIPYPLTILSHTVVITPSIFQLIFVATFIGALVNHGMFRSIYGIEGPLHNPKDPWTVRYQKLALTFSKTPGKRPRTFDELKQKLDASAKHRSNVLSKLQEGSLIARIIIVWYILRAIIRTGIITITRPIHTLVALGTTAVFYTLVMQSQVGLLGTGLFLAQAVFFIGVVVLNWFPSVVPRDSAPWLFVPEHRKSPDLYDQDEIAFEYDPRGFWDSVMSEVELLEASETQPETGEETKYIVPLSEEGPKPSADDET